MAETLGHLENTPSTTDSTSSPTIEYDGIVDEPEEHSRSQQQSLSPEISRLPAPRTPASLRSRDNSSAYYTAAPWGSPYSPSQLSHSARTARSEQVASDDWSELSPEPQFGLEHLVPSRLSDLSLPQPGSSVLDTSSDHLHTPRSRVQRWVQLPQRQDTSERARWWSSDDSASGVSDEQGTEPRAPSSTSSARRSKRRRSRPAHNSREKNRTLDQQSFWETLRETRTDEMAGLLESRWAATPEPSAEQQGQATAKKSKPEEGVFASRWADTPEPSPERQPKAPQEEQETSDGGPASETDAGAGNPADQVEDVEERREEQAVAMSSGDAGNLGDQRVTPPIEQPESEVKIVEPSVDFAKQMGTANGQAVGWAHTDAASPANRLDAPKLKKRVSWKGKNIVISIPRMDYGDTGLVKPMSKAEIDDRLKQFELAGYNTNGYDLTQETIKDGPSQVKDIFPDEAYSRAPQKKGGEVKVLLPDLDRWKAYIDHLTEAKLAALGVTLGSDEPASAASQDMSRQSSAQQYPPLPFSPPIPTSSAGSLSRPPMIRGHSHTMSVASPASPLNGPFGHMHRHSTFTGPIGLPPLQQPQQQSPGIPALQAFSPQQQPTFSGLPRGGSPAHIAAIRQDFGPLRGPGSPLSQQVQSPLDYSRGMVDDQRRRQHAYSQSMQQPSLPNAFMSQGSSMRPTPALPELPEDEDEEELKEPEPEPEPKSDPEPPVYVPPQKRVQANTEIAVPTPRGHRHNISEGLERELLEAEQRQKAASRDWIEVTEEEEERSQPRPFAQTNGLRKPLEPEPKPTEKDPLGAEHPVQETSHNRKKSASRFNVAAPSFTFNPGANFQPGTSFKSNASLEPNQPTFNFKAPALQTVTRNHATHRRQQSSGSFNAAAPAFKPATGEFSFSSSGPSFRTSGGPKPAADKERDGTIIDQLPSIFGKVNIPDIVKPARRSKAIAIVRPEQESKSASEYEDDEGRVAQGEAKRKQQRKAADDGDEVPKFADPTPTIPPPEKILGSNYADQLSRVDEVEAKTEDGLEDVTVEAEKTIQDAIVHAHNDRDSPRTGETKQNTHSHKHSTSLSAFATPFEPSFAPATDVTKTDDPTEIDPISDLEDGEIKEDSIASGSPVHRASPGADDFSEDQGSAAEDARPRGPLDFSSSERIDKVELAEPSFAEIDAVMQQLNAEESDREPVKAVSPTRMPSPGSHPMKGVTYLADYLRSDAPSPSPDRQRLGAVVGSQQDTSIKQQALGEWPPVHQLNKAEEAPASDWSGMLSPLEEEKLHARSTFFDSHIDKIISRVVEQRLQPLEESLRNIHSTVEKRNKSSDLRLHRSSSNAHSDADDEDEMSDERKQRPISRGRDKRVDQIKVAVMEALREQSPKRTQASMDIAELHAVLADMKVSFARAASASLELDDIRAVVDESLTRQSQAIVPSDPDGAGHRRQVSELEGRLNETLAGALEEANQRRAIEEREAEARRQLRLAEEEMQLLRENARDDESRVRAMEHERQDLLSRLERAEDACREAENAHRDVEEKLEDSEAGKDALQATLEEYRTSSNKWRQDIDEGKRAREELESTIASMERQNEEYHDSTSSMKRRLEKLHFDMATAAGQLASEKATWKAKEEGFRSRIELLESQQLLANRERAQLEDELRVARSNAADSSESRHSMEHLRATNATLEDAVRKLQTDLSEQQTLAVRLERQFHDAQESGRAEVHRTRITLETEIEAANHQVNLVRAELEAELVKARAELENARMEADTAKARFDHLIEEEETARREALRKVNHSNSIALDEARHKYESAIQELTSQHSRALSHAIEDKERSEAFLTEKLTLSDSKLRHFQERVEHLEERLEVARTAAQAAASNAKVSKVLPPAASSSGIPEKVSPQALRESILVLQEQLQDREARIESLQTELNELPSKLEERDTQINWLHELLDVRGEELADLVNTLSKPNFDRAAVRDTAIRIRTNLQMEQQGKERSDRSQTPAGGNALASLASFATPKAAQLTGAFNKWRSSMESSALRAQQQRPGMAGRSSTPSRSKPTSKQHNTSYSSGLMTPPTSNLRSSPMPDESSSLPPPRLHGRSDSNSSSLAATGKPRSRPASGTSQRTMTPLFREQSYDRDAEDNGVEFDDDDLDDVADSEPPAFRSLEAELEEPSAMTGAAD